MNTEKKQLIEQAWNDRELLKDRSIQDTIREAVEMLDKGHLRIAEKIDGVWQVNEWLKKAVILYFPINDMETMECSPFEFHDKIALKHGYAAQGVRVVPHAVARYGAYLAPGVVMMPSYVNIGAYVDSGTMVDTWATVGSCAQIGKHVHLSGGVGIGGVLEPVQAAPVIVEDHCFIGSRCIIVECAGGGGGRAGRQHRYHSKHPHHRRHGSGACHHERPRAGTEHCHSRQLHKAFPGRRLSGGLRSDYRPPLGIDRQEDLPQRRPARL